MATFIPILLVAWWLWLGYGYLARRAVWSSCGGWLAAAARHPGVLLRARATGYTLLSSTFRVDVTDGPLGPRTRIRSEKGVEFRDGWMNDQDLRALLDLR